MATVPDVFDGTEPVDLSGLPFDVAARAAERFATVDADRWGDWFAGSGVVPTDVTAGGDEALDSMWAGVLAAIDRGWFGSCTWKELVAAGPIPLWCRLRPSYEQYLGAAGCWVTAGLIALTGRWIEREWHGYWMLPPDAPGLDRSDPMIAIPGGKALIPQVQLVSIVGAAVALHGAPERNPYRLRELLYRHAPAGGPSRVEGDEPEGPSVDPADESGLHLVSFSDLQAHEEDERIDLLVEGLRGLPGIDDAHREDREVVLLRSELDIAALRELVEQDWRRFEP